MKVQYVDIKNLTKFFYKAFKKLLCITYLRKGPNNISNKQNSEFNSSVKRTSKHSNVISDLTKDIEEDSIKINGNNSEDEQKAFFNSSNRGRRSYNFLPDEENMLEEL